MTVLIADTSPINYLLLIDEISILQRLYRRVVIPDAVLHELMDEFAPPQVRSWVAQLPDWVEVRRAPETDELSANLDPGERAAIALAQLQPNVLLLIDDSAGRLAATLRGIPNIGTLGVLRAAAVRRLIDLRPALERLQATNFRVSKSLISQLLGDFNPGTD